MKDFYHRTITIENQNFNGDVSRMRTSNGFGSITIQYEGIRQLSFNNENGSDYVLKVKALIAMLTEVVDNNCTLPEPE